MVKENSNIENRLDRIEKSFSILLAKVSYETTLNGLLLEYLFAKRYGKEKVLEEFRKKAFQLCKYRYDQEGLNSEALLTNVIEQMEEKIRVFEETTEEMSNLLTKYRSREKELISDYEKAEHKAQQIQQQLEELILWTNQLIVELKTNYSRFKSNESLINEYIQKTPAPPRIQY